MTEAVKEFWDSMAEKYGTSNLATAPDSHYRKLEIQSIIDAVATFRHQTILDVGCGNGYTTKEIAKWIPEAEIIGIDYSEAMLAEALKEPVDGVTFHYGDVMSLTSHPALEGKTFDVVLSSRCLINLPDWDHQQTAISQMQDMMAPKGTLILVENCLDGLANLNRLRQRFQLPEIKPRWHNHLLDKWDLINYLYNIGLTRQKVENIGNMYYIASRVIYAKLCQDQGVEPDYNHPINKIACQLPSMGDAYSYSPNFMFVYTDGEGDKSG